MIFVKEMSEAELKACAEIWNEVVEEGKAFPQDFPLDENSARKFFTEQSFVGAAVDGVEIVGMYILHPNNVGRCGHICNASYAVRKNRRGSGVGEALVRHCIKTAGEIGFKILQFNAVVSSNEAALRLYEKLGFRRLGVIPGGFRNRDGEYEDIIPHYITLDNS